MVRRRRRDRGYLRRRLHAWMFQRVMFGKITNEENLRLTDMNGRRSRTCSAAAVHPVDRCIPAAVPAADGRLRERVRHAVRGEETGCARRLPAGETMLVRYFDLKKGPR